MGLEGEYLTGSLFIYYDGGRDGVELLHKVNGRISAMRLGDGDHIEIQDGLIREVITVNEALKTIKDDKSHKYHELGESLYQGVRARVKINHTTTKRLERETKALAIQNLLMKVKSGDLSEKDLARIIAEWDIEE